MTGLLRRIRTLERKKPPDEQHRGGARVCKTPGCRNAAALDQFSFLCPLHKQEVIDRIRNEILR